jgi:hypothetical protein
MDTKYVFNFTSFNNEAKFEISKEGLVVGSFVILSVWTLSDICKLLMGKPFVDP